ncbi:hypothetical protein JYT97_01985 [Haliea sp. AH-315-K21]|nr:hypothetical protein [Haliea sp. AH-315-K21]
MNNFLTAFSLSSDTIFFFTMLSLLTFLSSLIILPILILAIPSDYFVEKQRHPLPWTQSGYLLRMVVLLIKNLLGILMVFFGILLLVLPGQGILTLLAGIVLLDFPGKFLLLRWLARKDKILHSLNWVRKQGNKAPFIT